VEGELARPHAPVEICADSKYALGHASGKWLVPRKNTELVRRLRERVRDLVRQRGAPKYVTLSHVRARARTPGNEAADQLAKEVARDRTVSNDAMRALTIASTAHRRVRGESDHDRDILAAATSATSTTTPSTSAHGDGGTGEGVRRWVGVLSRVEILRKKRARGYTLQRGRRGLAGVGVGVGRAVLKLPCTKFELLE